jgi:parallel beta-helix repeat protein
MAAIAAASATLARAGDGGRATVRVGVDQGDIRGADNRALQAAVDQVAGLGGGTVEIGPGRFAMRNALSLRDHVRIRGTPGKTVLVACDGAETRLACDGDCNERQVTLEDPSAFRVGDGVSIQDEANSGGFTVTTATLTAKLDDRTFTISAPLYLDYLVDKKATARLAFPVVGGWGVKDATVEGLTIEGNASRRGGRLDGCRGGGIYLFECEDISIRDCDVRAYNGDGISFQVSRGVTVEGCTAERNTGLGLHPGSGSSRPIVRRCRAVDNGGDGMFVCWRVKHGLFEANELRGNAGAGVSIGHKDTDNLFRSNTIVGNAVTGVLFRHESEAMGAHRNVFESNRILDNGGTSGHPAVAVTVRGPHRDLVFRDNTLGSSSISPGRSVGILHPRAAEGLKSEGNRFLNVGAEVEEGP